MTAVIPVANNGYNLYKMNRNNNNDAGNPSKKKTGKVGFGKGANWWIIYLVIFGLIVLPSLINSFSAIREISWQQFEKTILTRPIV